MQKIATFVTCRFDNFKFESVELQDVQHYFRATWVNHKSFEIRTLVSFNDATQIIGLLRDDVPLYFQIDFEGR